MKFLSKLLVTFFLWLLEVVRATPWERQVIASTTCATQRINTGICSPALGETWYNGNFYQVIWNYNHPAYHSEENTINVYLLNRSNNGTFTPIKKWDSVPVAPGTLVVQVDDSWFLEPLPVYSRNRTRIAYLYLMKEGRNIQAEIENSREFPPPVQFRLMHNAMPVPPSSRMPGTGRNRESVNPVFHGWTIALLTVACFLFAALVICVVYWLTRGWQRRQEKRLQRQLHDEETKLPLQKETEGKDQAAASTPSQPIGSSITIHRTSAVQLLGTGGNSATSGEHPHQQENQQQQQQYLSPSAPNTNLSATTNTDNAPQKLVTNAAGIGSSSSSSQLPTVASDHRKSSSFLSSTDAIMIADTFRQFMRKPEWQPHSKGDQPAQTEDIIREDGASIIKQTPWDETEEQRKKLGDQLLHKELAEEGTSVHRIERRSTQRSILAPSPSPSTSTQERPNQSLQHDPKDQKPQEPEEQQQQPKEPHLQPSSGEQDKEQEQEQHN
ncbi:hypothetical protein BX666DRAFT_2022700 [Dichotomocladium elegans]|nr:hypothetical protein BX666DRAFT_2022700 [Dichotomocladium elegans]